MRDEKDPGTIEMALASRRGRKPINGVAMTAAERQAQYRFRRKAAANSGSRKLDAFTDTALLDRIRLELSDGNDRAAKRFIGELSRRYL